MPEDAELADAIDELKEPAACTLRTIAGTSRGAKLEWLLAFGRRRALPHRMERCGYVACRNPKNDKGYWRINGERATV